MFSFWGMKKPEIMNESAEKKVSSTMSIGEDSWLRKITNRFIWRQLVFYKAFVLVSWNCRFYRSFGREVYLAKSILCFTQLMKKEILFLSGNGSPLVMILSSRDIW